MPTKEEYESYKSSKGGAGQIAAAAWNTMSNPFRTAGAVSDRDASRYLETGGNANGGFGNQLTDPFGIGNALVGKYGSFNSNMDEGVFMSMSDDDWARFKMMSTREQDAFIEQRRAQIPDAAKAKSEADLAAQKEAEYQKWRQDTMRRLDDFSKEMGKPIDQLIREGDLGAISARDTGANMGAQAGYNAGVSGGGLSVANTQRAQTSAGLGYQMQRQQMGAQATQGLLGAMAGVSQEGAQQRAYNDNLNLTLQQAQAAAQQQRYQQASAQSGQTMGLIGAGVGAYFGGAAGAQAGYGLGSGLGQSSYQNQNPYQPYQYKTPNGQKPSSTPFYGSQ